MFGSRQNNASNRCCRRIMGFSQDQRKSRDMKICCFSTSLLVLLFITGIDAGGGWKKLKQEVAEHKARLDKADQPGGFALFDDNGRLPQDLLDTGDDKYSPYDLAWQSLHMSAAAACRGSTGTGGSGPWRNAVMVRNAPDNKSCFQICAATPFSRCDAEVSVYGKKDKATKNGQIVGYFYNYQCGVRSTGGNEASSSEEAVMNYDYAYFSYCCCRKP